MTDRYLVERIVDEPEADVSEYSGRWQVIETRTGAPVGLILESRRWNARTRLMAPSFKAVVGGGDNPLPGEWLGERSTVPAAAEVLIAHLCQSPSDELDEAELARRGIRRMLALTPRQRIARLEQTTPPPHDGSAAQSEFSQLLELRSHGLAQLLELRDLLKTGLIEDVTGEEGS